MPSNVFNRSALPRLALILISAAVVLLGAYLAGQLGADMMSPAALVGAWMMLALVAGYIVMRFRPAVGVPLLIGFAAAAAVVATFAGAAMMS
jgi:hypothetical protein